MRTALNFSPCWRTSVLLAPERAGDESGVDEVKYANANPEPAVGALKTGKTVATSAKSLKIDIEAAETRWYRLIAK